MKLRSPGQTSSQGASDKTWFGAPLSGPPAKAIRGVAFVVELNSNQANRQLRRRKKILFMGKIGFRYEKKLCANKWNNLDKRIQSFTTPWPMNGFVE